MRALAAVLVLATAGACGAHAASGPAWPKSAGSMVGDAKDDGGESLDPRTDGAVAAVEDAAEEVVVAADAPPATDTPASGDTTTVTLTPTTDETIDFDEILFEEDIVIEGD